MRAGVHALPGTPAPDPVHWETRHAHQKGCGAAVLQRYNTASQTWSQTGSLAVARSYGGLVTLQDGTALAISGIGQPAFGPSFPATACEIYLPSTGQWTMTGSIAVPRGNVVAAVLNTGQVPVTADHR